VIPQVLGADLPFYRIKPLVSWSNLIYIQTQEAQLVTVSAPLLLQVVLFLEKPEACLYCYSLLVGRRKIAQGIIKEHFGHVTPNRVWRAE